MPLFGAKSGYDQRTVVIRLADEKAEGLQRIADKPDLPSPMSLGGITRVRQFGGWRSYGDQALATYKALLRHQADKHLVGREILGRSTRRQEC
jgi:hypothetical protein